MNANGLKQRLEPYVLFVDMNSFFASCEQQENYWLRGRPVGVCVYTGKYGCVIAPSAEAKDKGVRTGMRLDEAIRLCPDLVPLETHPARYREFHVRMIRVLKKYSEDVIPKSIDEAVVNLHNYRLIYKDPEEVARKIKADIRNEVGDWLKCSIGIAPNAFLAKLASGLQKRDGLMTISPANIDQVLSGIRLTQLPGIARNMAIRLENAGINTPLDLRHTSAEKLQRACKSVVGLYWHYRLNFAEVDMKTQEYQGMSAMRSISAQNRRSLPYLESLLLSLCMTLEKRMVTQDLLCTEISIFIKYEGEYSWKQNIIMQSPVQDGIQLLHLIRLRMKRFEESQRCEPLINTNMTMISLGITRFVSAELVQYELFGNDVKKNRLRKVVYNIKEQFGKDKILKASELEEHSILKDVIGFGSVKDLHAGINE